MDLQKCLFCKNDGEPISHFPLPIEPGIVKIEPEIDNGHGQSESKTKHSALYQHNDESFILKDQLKSFFVLRKLLKLEESKLNEYLQINHGDTNPSSWFSLCSSCNIIVDECFSLYKEVMRWSIKLKERKTSLENLILQSRASCGKRRGRKRKNCGNDDAISLYIRTTIENSIKSNAEALSTSSNNISTTGNHCKHENLSVAKQRESDDVANNCKAVNTIQIFEKRSGQSENVKTGKGKEQQIPMQDRENDEFLGEDTLSDSQPLDFPDCDDDVVNFHGCSDEDFTIDTRFLDNEDEDDWLPSSQPKKRRKRKHAGTKARSIPELKATARRRKETQLSSPEEIHDNSNVASMKKEDEELQTMDNSKGGVYAPKKVITTCKSRKTNGRKKLGIVKEKLPSFLHNCSKCTARFWKKAKLDEHDQLLHKDGLGVECPECGRFVLKRQLGQHKKTHRLKIKCDKVKVKTNEKQHLQRKEKFKNICSAFKNIPYYCDHCPLIFVTPYMLEIHVNTFHSDQRLLVLCEHCPKSFESKQLIKLHCKVSHFKECPDMDNHIFGDNFPVPKKCSYCSLSFPSQFKMDFHMAKFHREHLYKCWLCSYSTDKYETLRKHHRYNHEPNSVYVCEICSRRFKYLISFNNHRRAEHYMELGLEPFRCEHCDRTLGNKRLLERHIKLVHGAAKEYFCEFCGKGFTWERTLQQHNLLHTAPKEKQYKQGPFFCEFCDAKFNVRQGLYYHLKNHHSDKYQYRCDKCGMGYFFERTLKTHRKKCVGDSGESKTNQS